MFNVNKNDANGYVLVFLLLTLNIFLIGKNIIWVCTFPLDLASLEKELDNLSCALDQIENWSNSLHGKVAELLKETREQNQNTSRQNQEPKEEKAQDSIKWKKDVYSNHIFIPQLFFPVSFPGRLLDHFTLKVTHVNIYLQFSLWRKNLPWQKIYFISETRGILFRVHIFNKCLFEFFQTTQPAFTCSKLTIETLEQGAKYVQN